jgi:hypothetical protein
VNLPVDKKIVLPYSQAMRKKTRRKIYPLVNPITHAIEGACITDEATLSKLRWTEIAAICAFRIGTATKQEWHELNEMTSIAEVMARAGVGVEVLEVARQAESHLKKAALRFDETGKMELNGFELLTLSDLQEYHDLQRQSVSRGEYWLFIKKMIDLRTSGSPIVEIL